MTCPNCGTELRVTERRRCVACNYPVRVADMEPSSPPSGPGRSAAAVDGARLLVGWLVRHVEGQAAHTFPVYEGDSTVGRPATGHAPDIVIENDPHVSRIHATLNVLRDGTHFRFRLTDGGDRPSLNGIYLNGEPQRIAPDTPVDLTDGDTIQIGLTKLVLQSVFAADHAAHAATCVAALPYTQTVDLQPL